MATNQCTEAERQEVLEQLPQKPPFLFLDRILELSTEHIIAERRFTGEEDFYKGHFPGDPVTPGVILTEAMAQAGLVALGIHLLNVEGQDKDKIRTLFTDCAVEFNKIVRPGELVTIRAEKIFWRRRKLQSQAELVKENGEIAASGTISGFGVLIE